MSFKVEGTTQLVVEKEILEEVSKRHGWTVEYDTTIRSHDIATGKKFEVVLRNPESAYQSYDVGIDYAEDGKTAEFIYDRWGDSVEKAFGENCGSFKNECAVATIKKNDADVPVDMSYDEYFEKFCSYDESGDLIYDGYSEGF
jgi:hypothetical protein